MANSTNRAWVFSDEDQVIFKQILDLESLIRRSNRSEFLEAAKQELSLYIERLSASTLEECQRDLNLNCALPTSSEEVLELFELYHLQKELRHRVEKMAVDLSHYGRSRPSLPLVLKQVVQLEVWLEGQRDLERRFRSARRYLLRYNIDVQDLRPPFGILKIEALEDQVQEAIELERDFEQITDSFKKIGWARVFPLEDQNRVLLESLKDEFEDQNRLFRRHQHIAEELNGLGIPSAPVQFPLREGRIARLEEDVPYQRKWLGEFERIRRVLLPADRKKIVFPRAPFDEEEVFRFLEEVHEPYQKALFWMRYVPLFIATLVVVATALGVWSHVSADLNHRLTRALEIEFNQYYASSIDDRKQMWRELCEDGEELACLWSERILETDSTDKKIELFNTWCLEGKRSACLVTGWSLSQPYMNGTVLMSGSDLPRAEALFFELCSKGNHRACIELLRFPEDYAPKYYPEHPEMLLQDSCSEVVRGCSSLGMMYEKALRPQEQIVELYSEACSRGGWSSCNNLGLLYQYGKGVPQDLVQAEEHYEQACNHGFLFGCLNWAQILEHFGQGEGALARSLREKACDNRLFDGCYQLAMSDLRSPNPRFVEVLEHMDFACIGGVETACSIREKLLLERKNGELNYLQKFFSQGYSVELGTLNEQSKQLCEDGSELICSWSEVVEDLSVRAEQVQFFSEQCTQGEALGCLVDGWGLSQPHLDGALAFDARSLEQAKKHFDKACYLGLSQGCFEGSKIDLLTKKISQEKYFETLLSACSVGDQSSCVEKGKSQLKSSDPSERKSGLQVLKQACDAEFDAGCVELGRAYWIEGIPSPNEAKTKRLFQSACEHGFLRGCYFEAKLVLEEGLDESIVQATRMFFDSCNKGDELSCVDLAWVLLKEDEVEHQEQVKDLFERTCSDGIKEGCSGLGWIYEQGVGVEQDLIRSRILYERACSEGHASSCVDLAHMLSEGRGGEVEFERSTSLLEQACSQKAWNGCLALSERYQLGIGLEQSLLKATEFAQLSCDAGLMKGCVQLANIWMLDSDQSQMLRATELYERACVANEISGCHQLAFIYKDNSDALRAQALWQQGCNEDFGSSCTQLGILHEEEVDLDGLKTARSLYERACQTQDMLGCVHFALSVHKDKDSSETDRAQADELIGEACLKGISLGCFYKGKKLEQNRSYREAVSLYRSACEQQLWQGCSALAELYIQGLGTRKDRGTAASLLEQSCLEGHLPACQKSVELMGTEQLALKDAVFERLEERCSQGTQDICVAFGATVMEYSKDLDRRHRAEDILIRLCSESRLQQQSCSVLARIEYQHFCGIPQKDRCLNFTQGNLNSTRQELLLSESDLLDYRKALSRAQKACDVTDPLGCAYAGRLTEMGLMIPDLQIGVDEAYSQARDFYRLGCEEKSQEACFSLGMLIDYRRGVLYEPERSAELYKDACQSGLQNACMAWGWLYLWGQGVVQDRSKAARLFKGACEEGFNWGCLSYGYSLEHGYGLKRSQSRAEDQYRKLCSQGMNDACFFWGRALLGRSENSLAQQVFKDSCEDGFLSSCYEQALLLMSSSEKQGFAILEKACDKGHSSSCVAIADDLFNSSGPSKDVLEAQRLYLLACKEGHAQACAQIGLLKTKQNRLVATVKDTNQTIEFLYRGCMRGAPDACTLLGQYYQIKRRGAGRQLSFAKVVEVLDVSCRQDQLKSCVALGVFYTEDQRLEEANDYFNGACEQGDTEGCHWKNKGIIEEIGVSKQRAGFAVDELKQLCSDGFSLSCFEVGKIFGSSDLVEEDLSRFIDYLNRGCALQHKGSCTRLVEVYVKGYKSIEKNEQLADKYRALSEGL
ncbi:MAG: hypothetical protein CMK59_07115 [Proteobacteria bacterium]|nr:hypothetical protein [Pseudomonadota bacterium]